MNNYLSDIVDFIKDFSGCKKVFPDSDIMMDCGIDGDDCHDLIDKYAQMFQVNMDNYLWYFHCNEEGCSIGALFFKPPYKQVARIPVTPIMLADFATLGKWGIKYPKHQLKKHRYDIVMDQVLFYSVLIWLVIALIYKYIF